MDIPSLLTNLPKLGRALKQSLSPHDFSEIRKITFEGGLGSQILPFLEMEYLKTLKAPFVVDISYFEVNEKIAKYGGGADHWSFKLNRYGVSLEELADQAKNSDSPQPLSSKKNFDLWNADFYNFVKSEAPNLLRINFSNLGEFKKMLGISEEVKYSVVHVRRGDYLRVASHIINDEDWLALISSLSSIVNEVLVVTSDSKIPRNTKSRLRALVENTKVIFLEGGDFDECTLHDFMREANLLITSNSTFSFTAALLAKPNSLSFVPSIFYGDEDLEHINKAIRNSGTFFLSN